MPDVPDMQAVATAGILLKLFQSIAEQKEVQFNPLEAKLVLQLLTHHTFMLKTALGSLESAAGSLDSLKEAIAGMAQSIESPLQPITRDNSPASSAWKIRDK